MTLTPPLVELPQSKWRWHLMREKNFGLPFVAYPLPERRIDPCTV